MNDPLFNLPSVVRPAEDLATLFAAAQAEHEAGRDAERASLEHYRKAGEALLRAKDAAGHGNWLAVLRERCKIPQQRASEYMRLASGWGKLPPGGDFTLKGALHLLAAPKAGEVGQEVNVPVALIRIGERVRKSLGDLQGLAASIRDVGLLQPIIINPDYLLLCGRRRLEACKLLRWDTVPAVISDMDPLYAEFTENSCWQEYTPLEKLTIGEALGG
jgi:hypothetical protein